jgi:ribosomal protein S18 acetylase RimI-like enzyme
MARPLYHLEYHDAIPYEEILYQGISKEASAKKFPPMQPLGIFIKDREGIVIGGISALMLYGSLYIDSLWVGAAARRQGWGTKLIQEAERIGKERGAKFATLNTMDFLETVPFYQKLGYSIEFIREGYAENSKMFLLRKTL